MNMTVEWNTRLCTVKGETGYFHTWEHYSKPLPASPLVGGEPAGLFSQIFGIVEFKDGVRRVDPTAIIFCDEQNSLLNQPPIKEGKTIEAIRDVLIASDAVSCSVESYEPELYASEALYHIPASHCVKVDYNKLAAAIYKAGYRKEVKHDSD